MAHYQELKWVELVAEFFGLRGDSSLSILEVGSYDVDGSVRGLFSSVNYTGVDLTNGPGVDVVAGGHEVDFEENQFDLALACEVFEHNPYWAETFVNMHRMIKSGGFLIMTCATKGRLEHGTARTSPSSSPGTQAVGWDYYRNLVQADFQEFPLNEMFDFHYFGENRISKDLYFVGQKRGASSTDDGQVNLKEFMVTTKPAFQHDPSKGAFRRTLSALYRLPLSLFALILSEEKYQQVGLVYSSLMKPIAKTLNR